jgi:hydrogenase maturation protease
MRRNRTAVIGLGNRLLADEGAGLHAVELLEKKLHAAEKDSMPTPGVDVIEAGTPGMNLLHQFDEREKIIFIDAGNCQMAPGRFRRFTPAEAVSLKTSKRHSLHEFDLMGFLEFAGRIGVSENVDVVIYCIQADEVAMSETLSPVVRDCLPLLVQEVYQEIQEKTWNHNI